MKLSIIIPHHNGEELLFNCLESILNQISIKDFEIIVVDNGSIDNSADKAKEKFPSINLLKSETNLGYSCLLYTSPSPRDLSTSRMPSSA